MKKKIWELESEFMGAFYNAVNQIQRRYESGEPMTLKEVLEFGFNNVDFEDKSGFETTDFTEEELNKKVRFDEYFLWDEDADGYRFIILREAGDE